MSPAGTARYRERLGAGAGAGGRLSDTTEGVVGWTEKDGKGVSMVKLRGGSQVWRVAILKGINWVYPFLPVTVSKQANHYFWNKAWLHHHPREHRV